MSVAPLAYERAGSGEWLMRIGDAAGAPLLFVPPLFEEMNRTRALLAAVMRAMATRGLSCWLADLPGAGESERPLSEIRWDDWRAAVRAAADHCESVCGRRPHCASVRGGALLDDAAAAASCWRFAPASGASLARDIARAAMVGGAEFAGYPVSPELLASLEAAVPAPLTPLRIVKLATDRTEADERLEGPALWRRSEPATSAGLSDAIAADIDQWVRQCAGS